MASSQSVLFILSLKWKFSIKFFIKISCKTWKFLSVTSSVNIALTFASRYLPPRFRLPHSQHKIVWKSCLHMFTLHNRDNPFNSRVEPPTSFLEYAKEAKILKYNGVVENTTTCTLVPRFSSEVKESVHECNWVFHLRYS